jgi:aldehyde:ferredoxin oxidoreductase
MAGCFRCPVNCRPLNDLGADGFGDRYDRGDGPEYVTVGKFGPNLGIEDPRLVIRFNNICNDLGLDTASSGSAIGWAMELYQRGLIERSSTAGLELTWGNAEVVEKLLHQTAARAGFGAVIADSAAAVRTGRYPEAALDFRNAVKGLFQSDPHDARILKAFALGLAVSTRGSDHLRNRVTLEINSKINDSPEFKAQLYGPGVSAQPNSYEGKEIAVKVCENIFGVGDAVGMCRFTTHLFNSPSLPGLEQFQEQIHNVSGLVMEREELDRAGDNINGIERLLNYRFGIRREDDTLPRRWFEEGMPWGPYEGEKIDREQFDALLDRFYALRRLNREGIPEVGWRTELVRTMTGFSLTLRLPSSLRALGNGSATDGALIVEEPVATIGELIEFLDRRYPKLAGELRSSVYNFAVNQELILHQRDRQVLRSGDVVEILPTFAGG